jgi:hypothetical protein
MLGEPGGTIFRLSRDFDLQLWEAHHEKLFGITLAGSLLTSIGVGFGKLLYVVI